MTDIPITGYFVLIYDVVDDYVARRAPHREDHLRLATEHRQRGEFVMGGAVGDPPDRAFIVFSGDRSVAEGLAGRDPYVRAGLVRRWEVQPWAVVAGEALDAPAGLQR